VQITRPTLLVVDDDAAVLETLARLLQHYGFDVVPENDAVSAIAAIYARDDIDGMVTDFEMPGFNGAQLARAAKDKNPAMPVFICSGINPPEFDSPPWDGWFLKGAHVTELIRQLQVVTGAAGDNRA